MSMDLEARIAELDAELIELAKPIMVLKHLTWPDEVQESFLASWSAKRPVLPEVNYQIPDWSKDIAALDDFVERARGDHAILEFLRRTAWSYAEAARMLMAAGTPQFTECSIHLYGRPNDIYETQCITGVDAAAFLMEKTEALLGGGYIAPRKQEMGAEEFAKKLQEAVDRFFVEDRIEVLVDNTLSSKAIAGTTRIRVRASAMFSDLDFDQLYNHEALVHVATAVNGSRQPRLKSLRLGAPRTTRTQEGIAVFSELVTRCMDIKRLRRIALRILALKNALDGADFIECFKLFLEAGDTEREAFQSAQRIFRGGDVRGKIAFTKDSAYLKGLMETHVLLNVAIRDNQPQIIRRLFAGRMSLSDPMTLAPYFDSGFIERACYVPPWACDTDRLAATLAYSSFMMKVDLAPVTLEGIVRAFAKYEAASQSVS